MLLPAGRCRCRIINGKETPFQKKSTGVNHTTDDDNSRMNMNNDMDININK